MSDSRMKRHRHTAKKRQARYVQDTTQPREMVMSLENGSPAETTRIEGMWTMPLYDPAGPVIRAIGAAFLAGVVCDDVVTPLGDGRYLHTITPQHVRW